MSGSLIVPDEIPGTDVTPEAISAAAASYRSTARSVRERSDAVVTSWSGLAGVYSAPEAPQLLASMTPVATDAHTIADKLGRVSALLDELAETVAGPVRRLKELKAEAEAFVASVAGGVTVDYYDPDNPLYQANAVSGAPVILPEGQGQQTISWAEHTPSVERNNELLQQVNAEVAKLLAARADCVNGINALREDMCVAAEQAPTVDQLNAATDLPWGAQGKGDRSCTESVGDGLWEFGSGIVSGVAALGGWNTGDGWSHDWDYAGQAWGGLLQGLGALAITVGNPGLAVAAYAPEEAIPESLRPARDWYRGQLDAIVGSVVGTPEQWEEDPIAAGTYAVASIATFFIPVAGQAGAGVKASSALARAGVAAEKLAGIAGDGTRLANGLVRSGDLFAKLNDTVRGLDGAGSATRSLDETMAALEDIPDVVPNNLVPGNAVSHVGAHADSPAVEVKAGAADSDTIAGGAGSTASAGIDRGHGGVSDGLADGRGDMSAGNPGLGNAGAGSEFPNNGTDSPRDGGTTSDTVSDGPRAVPPEEVRRPADNQPAVGDTDGSIGRWVEVSRGPKGLADQEFATGVERLPNGNPLEYVVRAPSGMKIEFDGHLFRGDPPIEVFQEVKGNYSWLHIGFKSPKSQMYEWLEKARDRVEAIAPTGGTLEWIFTRNPEFVAPFTRLLRANGLSEVVVRYVPMSKDGS